MGEAFGWYKRVVIERYARFQGRARRREFWFFTLVNTLISLGFGILDAVLGAGGLLRGLYTLAVFLPSLAVSVRRLHDLERSGWLVWLPAVPAIATAFGALTHQTALAIAFGLAALACAIYMVVLYATTGTAGPNQYGEDPKALPATA